MENRQILRQITANYKKLQEYPFMSIHPEIMANRLRYQSELDKLFNEFGIHGAMLDNTTIDNNALIKLMKRLNNFLNKYKIKDIDPMSTKQLEMEQQVHRELYKMMNEVETDNKEANKDEKLEQLLNDMNDISTLLSKKFNELKKSEEQLIAANTSEDEYGTIQSENMKESLSSIKKTLVNLGKTYQFFLTYIEKYGYSTTKNKEN
jgi:phage-related minor tail protein